MVPYTHPRGLSLYKIDFGITYWMALESNLQLEELRRVIVKFILEDDDYTCVGDPLVEYENIYMDEAPRLKEIFIVDRDTAIQTRCHVDDGKTGDTTMWHVFCGTVAPGVISCSEW